MKRIYTSLLSLLLLTIFVVNPAKAAGYFGAGVGSVDIEGADDSSIKFFGGFREDGVGFEAAYHDLGKQEESAFGLTASMEITAIELSGVGFFSASPTVDLFGKVGLLSWNADLSLTGYPDVSTDGSDLIFGIGAQFNPSNTFSIRAEYQTSTLDIGDVDFDTDVVSIAAVFNF